MALPDSYTLKPGSIAAYFDALLDGEAPDRFTVRFLQSLEFKSTNDRKLIGILKELGFIDDDGIPKDRYFEFLDRSQSAKVVADGIREAYSDLFAVNKRAHELSSEAVKNKLRTLYKGAKKDGLIGRIGSTFAALCEYADFSAAKPAKATKQSASSDSPAASSNKEKQKGRAPERQSLPGISLAALQYHINIVLPESRDQAVYDAIFKSLRDHLGNAE